jgi:hypothetical protein
MYHLQVHNKDNKPNQGAPEYEQINMRTIADRNNAGRTVVLLPWPKRPESGTGMLQDFHSWWMPVDFTGLNSEVQLQTWTAGGDCATATASVGQTLPAYQLSADSYTAATAKGLESICFFLPKDARCRIAAGSIRAGPRVRVLLTDDAPLPGQEVRRGNKYLPPNPVVGGHPPQRVRGVAVARIVCYFRSTTDTCRDIVDYTAPIGDTGFPVGTILMLVEPLRSMDLAPDVILGDKVGYNQRLVLVR